MDNRSEEALYQIIYTDAHKYMKSCLMSFVIRKIQLKQQWDVTINWLEYTILKSLGMQCFGRMQRIELSVIAGWEWKMI